MAYILLYTIKFYQKTVVEKFSFSELKIEKVKFFTKSSTNTLFAVAFLMLEVA